MSVRQQSLNTLGVGNAVPLTQLDYTRRALIIAYSAPPVSAPLQIGLAPAGADISNYALINLQPGEQFRLDYEHDFELVWQAWVGWCASSSVGLMSPPVAVYEAIDDNWNRKKSTGGTIDDIAMSGEVLVPGHVVSDILKKLRS